MQDAFASVPIIGSVVMLKWAPFRAMNPPFRNFPKRILGPCKSSRIAAYTLAAAEISRIVRMRAACMSSVPCDMFNRKTLTPERSSWSMSCGVSLAGPRVATILVFGMRPSKIARTRGDDFSLYRTKTAIHKAPDETAIAPVG